MTESENWLNTTTSGSYHSYLVRVWQTDPQSEWRALVESIGSGERYIFTNLAEFQHFLLQLMAPQNDAPSAGSHEIIPLEDSGAKRQTELTASRQKVVA